MYPPKSLPPRDELPPEPFGRAGRALGVFADGIARHLVAEPDDINGRHYRFRGRDKSTLSSLWNFYDWLPEVQVRPDLGDDQLEIRLQVELHRLLGVVATTMPFDHAEREWLLGLYDGRTSEPRADKLRRMRAAETDQLWSRGQRKAATGRELFRRWWLWRRQAEEYSDGAVTHTAMALSDIADISGFARQPGRPKRPYRRR